VRRWVTGSVFDTSRRRLRGDGASGGPNVIKHGIDQYDLGFAESCGYRSSRVLRLQKHLSGYKLICSLTRTVELAGYGQQKRDEIVQWLRERRDTAERREDRLETVEWAILIFVVMGVAADIAILFASLTVMD
jgi:hypothetical protein